MSAVFWIATRVAGGNILNHNLRLGIRSSGDKIDTHTHTHTASMEARASSMRRDDNIDSDDDRGGGSGSRQQRGPRPHHRRSRSRSPSGPVPPPLLGPQGPPSKPDRPKLSFGISTILSDEEPPSGVTSSGPPPARVTSSSALAPLEIVFGIPFHGLCAAAASSGARYLGYYAHAQSVGGPGSGLELFKPEMYPFLPGLIKMAPQPTSGMAGCVVTSAADCHVTPVGGLPVSGLTSAIFPWMQERKDRLSGEIDDCSLIHCSCSITLWFLSF